MEDKILVIGNGFDLAHGLKTRYKDFIDFIKLEESDMISRYKEDNKLSEEKIKENIEKIKKLVQSNIWLEYFNDIIDDPMFKFGKSINENWIDFENEISEVIQGLEIRKEYNPNKKLKKEIDDKKGDTYYLLKKGELIKSKLRKGDNSSLTKDYYKNNIIEPLKNALNELIDCLELYLELEENRTCTTKIEWVQTLNVNKLLSFNYTNTYLKIYGKEGIEDDFIHGKIRNNSEDDNNIVLGIDEYLTEPIDSEGLDFIEFKKYFQRIYKKNGCRYKEWLCSSKEKKEVHIFGHSLDITDGDVLRELICNEYTKIYVYYHNKEQYSSQIINLIKVLGKEELIRFAYENNPKITFVDQTNIQS